MSGIAKYKQKYLKYKNKYLTLKNQIGGKFEDKIKIMTDKSNRYYLYTYELLMLWLQEMDESSLAEFIQEINKIKGTDKETIILHIQKLLRNTIHRFISLSPSEIHKIIDFSVKIGVNINEKFIDSISNTKLSPLEFLKHMHGIYSISQNIDNKLIIALKEFLIPELYIEREDPLYEWIKTIQASRPDDKELKDKITEIHFLSSPRGVWIETIIKQGLINDGITMPELETQTQRLARGLPSDDTTAGPRSGP